MNRPFSVIALSISMLAVTSMTTATASASVRTCRPATVYRSYDKVLEETVVYRASRIRRTSRISCAKAVALLSMSYGQGPIKPIHVDKPDVGRYTYWARGGWRATNGAGGATAWNAKDDRYNEVDGMAVIADVDLG